MPPSLRNRAQAQDSDDTDSEVELSFNGHAAGSHDMQEEDEEEEEDELVGEEDEDEEAPGASQTPLLNLDPPPSYLREISTLASWTVSSSKPGCSIPQLRHPSTSLFWQSDGPQPHYLNIHFFKLVRIVGLRLFLDFEQDESYTPTRIIFLAGSGMNDLQEWSEMKLESPRGWIWADFSNVGDPDDDADDEDDEGDTMMTDRAPLPITTTHQTHPTDASSDSENANPQHPRHTPQHHQTPQAYTHTQTPQFTQPGFAQNQTPQTAHTLHTPQYTQTPSFTSPPASISRPLPRQPFTALSTTPNPPASRLPRMPVLRAHLVQIKILENHQNGKDTHLRGLQIFARNDEKEGGVGSARITGMDGVGAVKKKGKGRGGVDLDRVELGGLGDEVWVR